jgi:hypothetical protein
MVSDNNDCLGAIHAFKLLSWRCCSLAKNLVKLSQLIIVLYTTYVSIKSVLAAAWLVSKFMDPSLIGH